MSRSVGAAADPSKYSIRPQVDLTHEERSAARVPPLPDVLGLRPSFEDDSARSIKGARDDDVALGGRGDLRAAGDLHGRSLLIASCVHVVSPSSAVHSGNRPSWRIAA